MNTPTPPPVKKGLKSSYLTKQAVFVDTSHGTVKLKLTTNRQSVMVTVGNAAKVTMAVEMVRDSRDAHILACREKDNDKFLKYCSDLDKL